MGNVEQATGVAPNVASVGAPRPEAAPRWPAWSALFAATAAFSGYLALVGGALLAIRFRHAGLPVAPSVSAVSFSTLITTALVQLLLPALGLAIFGGAFMFHRLDSRKNGEPRTQKSRLIVLAIGVAVGIFILPLNTYGLALFGTFLIPFVLGEWVLPSEGHTERKAVVVAIVMIAIAASLPVLIRQTIEPLNMERVRIERPGKPPLIADLVAIRDASVVVARCHHLIVLPTPAWMRVEQLPNITGVGASVVEKLGIGTDNIVKPRHMPC